MSDSQRRAAGWALFAIGALSTIPLAMEVLGKNRPAAMRTANLAGPEL